MRCSTVITTCAEHYGMMVGRTADPDKIRELTGMAYHHHPAVRCVDTV